MQMAYTVDLDNFNGPLDLLLYLIQKEEVEIHDIPIKVICDRYLEYLKALEFLDVDVSSEFLVMAATLMLIKSRSLLPIEDEIDLEEELDPEDELIQQLLEYKRYKVASRDLAEMADLRSRIFPLVPPRSVEAGEEKEIELEDVDLWDLVRAFATLLKETGLHRLPRVIRSDKPLRAYIEEVFDRVRRASRVSFRELFEGAAERGTVVGRFVAILELVRRGRITVSQTGYGQIDLEIADNSELSEEEIDLMEADLQSDAEENDGDDEGDDDGGDLAVGGLADFVDDDSSERPPSEADPSDGERGRVPNQGADPDDPPAFQTTMQ